MAGEIRANSVVRGLHTSSVSLGKTCQGGFQSHSPNTCLGSAAKRKPQCPSALLSCCTKGTSSACESIFSHGYCLYKELRALPHVSIRFKLQRILFRTIQTFTSLLLLRKQRVHGLGGEETLEGGTRRTTNRRGRATGSGGGSRRSPAASPAFAGARLAPGGRGGHRTVWCCAGVHFFPHVW